LDQYRHHRNWLFQNTDNLSYPNKMQRQRVIFRPYFMIAVLAICMFGIYFCISRFKFVDPKVGEFIAPPAEISHMSFGYPEMLADFLWIRVVQDFGYCESRDGIKSKNEYEYSRVIKHDATKFCHKSWVYQMLDRITDLDPKFHLAFQAGGTMLSLLVNDREGAQALFNKGLRIYPDDWNMNYRAGYHQLFEMKNEAKAAQYFLKASQNGAPAWLAQLAARLYTKQGKAEIGKVILEDFKKNNPDMAESARFKELSAKIDEVLKSDREPATSKTSKLKSSKK
jgi:tetratricopeptide (TPR) repeat protein